MLRLTPEGRESIRKWLTTSTSVISMFGSQYLKRFSSHAQEHLRRYEAPLDALRKVVTGFQMRINQALAERAKQLEEERVKQTAQRAAAEKTQVTEKLSGHAELLGTEIQRDSAEDLGSSSPTKSFQVRGSEIETVSEPSVAAKPAKSLPSSIQPETSSIERGPQSPPETPSSLKQAAPKSVSLPEAEVPPAVVPTQSHTAAQGSNPSQIVGMTAATEGRQNQGGSKGTKEGNAILGFLSMLLTLLSCSALAVALSDSWETLTSKPKEEDPVDTISLPQQWEPPQKEQREAMKSYPQEVNEQGPELHNVPEGAASEEHPKTKSYPVKPKSLPESLGDLESHVVNAMTDAAFICIKVSSASPEVKPLHMADAVVAAKRLKKVHFVVVRPDQRYVRMPFGRVLPILRARDSVQSSSFASSSPVSPAIPYVYAANQEDEGMEAFVPISVSDYIELHRLAVAIEREASLQLDIPDSLPVDPSLFHPSVNVASCESRVQEVLGLRRIRRSPQVPHSRSRLASSNQASQETHLDDTHREYVINFEAIRKGDSSSLQAALQLLQRFATECADATRVGDTSVGLDTITMLLDALREIDLTRYDDSQDSKKHSWRTAFSRLGISTLVRGGLATMEDLRADLSAIKTRFAQKSHALNAVWLGSVPILGIPKPSEEFTLIMKTLFGKQKQSLMPDVQKEHPQSGTRALSAVSNLQRRASVFVSSVTSYLRPGTQQSATAPPVQDMQHVEPARPVEQPEAINQSHPNISVKHGRVSATANLDTIMNESEHSDLEAKEIATKGMVDQTKDPGRTTPDGCAEPSQDLVIKPAEVQVADEQVQEQKELLALCDTVVAVNQRDHQRQSRTSTIDAPQQSATGADQDVASKAGLATRSLASGDDLDMIDIHAESQRSKQYENDAMHRQSELHSVREMPQETSESHQAALHAVSVNDLERTMWQSRIQVLQQELERLSEARRAERAEFARLSQANGELMSKVTALNEEIARLQVQSVSDQGISVGSIATKAALAILDTVQGSRSEVVEAKRVEHIESVASERAELTTERDALRSEVEQLEAEKVKLALVTRTASQHAHQLESIVQGTEAKLQQLTAEVQQLEQQKLQLMSAMTQCKQQHTSLVSDLSILEGQRSTLSTGIADLEEQRRSLVAELSVMSQKKAQIASEISQLEDEHVSKQKAAQTQYDELNAEIAKLEAEKSQLQATISELAEKAQECESTTGTLRANIDELKQQQQALLTTQQDLEIAIRELQQRHEGLRTEVMQLETEKTSLESQVRTLESEIVETQRLRDANVSGTINALSAEMTLELEELQTRKTEASHELNQLVERKDTVNRSVAALESTLRDLESQHVMLSEQVAKLEESKSVLESQAAEIGARVVLLEEDPKERARAVSELETKRTNLVDTTERLTADVERLKSEVASLTSDLSTLEDAKKSLLATTEETRSQLNEFETNRAKTEGELSRLLDESSQLERSKSSLDEVLAAMTTTRAGLESQLAQLRAEKDSLISEIEGLCDTETQLQASSSQKKQAVDELEHRKVSLEAELAQLAARSKELDDFHQTVKDLTDRRDKVEAQFTQISEEYANLDKSKLELQEQVGSLESRKREVESVVNELSVEKARLEEQVSQLRVQEQEVASRCYSVRSEIAELEKVASQTASRRVEEESQLEALLQRRESEESMINDLTSRRLKLESELKECSENLQKSKADVALAEARQLELNASIAELAKEVQRVELQVKQANEQIAQQQRTRQDLDAEIADKSIQLTGLNAAIAAATVAAASAAAQVQAEESRLKELKAAVDELRERRYEAEANIASAEAKHEQLLSSIADLDKELSGKQDTKEQYMLQIGALEEEIRQLESSREEYGEAVRCLGEKLQQLTNESKVAEMNVEELNAKCEEARERYNAAEQRLESLKASSEAAVAELENLKSQCKVVENQLLQLAADRQTVEAQLRSLQDDEKTLKAEVLRTRAELADSKAKLDNFKAQHQSEQEKVYRLISERETLESQVQLLRGEGAIIRQKSRSKTDHRTETKATAKTLSQTVVTPADEQDGSTPLQSSEGERSVETVESRVTQISSRKDIEEEAARQVRSPIKHQGASPQRAPRTDSDATPTILRRASTNILAKIALASATTETAPIAEHKDVPADTAEKVVHSKSAASSPLRPRAVVQVSQSAGKRSIRPPEVGQATHYVESVEMPGVKQGQSIELTLFPSQRSEAASDISRDCEQERTDKHVLSLGSPQSIGVSETRIVLGDGTEFHTPKLRGMKSPSKSVEFDDSASHEGLGINPAATKLHIEPDALFGQEGEQDPNNDSTSHPEPYNLADQGSDDHYHNHTVDPNVLASSMPPQRHYSSHELVGSPRARAQTPTNVERTRARHMLSVDDATHILRGGATGPHPSYASHLTPGLSPLQAQLDFSSASLPHFQTPSVAGSHIRTAAPPSLLEASSVVLPQAAPHSTSLTRKLLRDDASDVNQSGATDDLNASAVSSADSQGLALSIRPVPLDPVPSSPSQAESDDLFG